MTQVNGLPGALDPPTAAPEALSATRPLYWSVRRELWENRSIYLAPLAVAGVFLFGYSLSLIMLPHRLRGAALDPAKQDSLLVMPFSAAASLIILTSFIVGAFYCLDALYGERRDRSILFWKSLPVSDRTTVLSKAGIPLVVLPLIAIVVSLATQLVMLFLSTLVLSASSVGAAALWSRLPLVSMTLIMFYGVAVHALWHAPLYAWLLLISGWARRTPLLWVVLPPMALGIFERITIHTSLVGWLLKDRLIGAMKVAFVPSGQHDIRSLSQLDPLRFLITPGLWIGLIAAAAFLSAAARLRRYREPI